MARILQNLLMEVAKIKKLQTTQIRIRRPQPSITDQLVIGTAVLTGFLLTGPVGVLAGLLGWAVYSLNKVLRSVSQTIVNHLTLEQQKDLVAQICGDLNTLLIPSASDFEINVARNPARLEVVIETVISFIEDQPDIEFVNPEGGRREQF